MECDLSSAKCGLILDVVVGISVKSRWWSLWVGGEVSSRVDVGVRARGHVV